MRIFFRDREEAGQLLAQALLRYKEEDLVILGLPRGGVVLAAEAARLLKAPLDCIFARKIGHPLQAEYAIAAISESGEMVGNSKELENIDPKWLEQEKKKNLLLMQQRRQAYFAGKPTVSIAGKVAIIVDDGIATGLTLLAAILEAKKLGPKKLVVAVPVSPKSTADKIRSFVDELIVLEEEEDSAFLGSVGAYYQQFSAVVDEQVQKLLSKQGV